MRRIVLFPASSIRRDQMEQVRAKARSMFKSEDLLFNVSSSDWGAIGGRWQWLNSQLRTDVEREIGTPLVTRWLRPTTIRDVDLYEFCTMGSESMQGGNRIHLFPLDNYDLESAQGSVVRAIESSILPVTSKRICVEAPTEPCAVPLGSSVEGVLRVVFWASVATPTLHAWELAPSNVGHVVRVRGEPLAEILGDHTVLILRNVLRNLDTAYIGEVLSEVGAALRTIPKEVPAKAEPTHTVTALLDHFGSVSIHDVPAGSPLIELVAAAGKSASPATATATMNGREVPFSTPVEHGARVLIRRLW